MGTTRLLSVNVVGDPAPCDLATGAGAKVSVRAVADGRIFRVEAQWQQ